MTPDNLNAAMGMMGGAGGMGGMPPGMGGINPQMMAQMEAMMGGANPGATNPGAVASDVRPPREKYASELA